MILLCSPRGPRGEAGESGADAGSGVVLGAPLMILLDRRGDRVDHVLVAKRLRQEVDGSGLHGADGDRGIAVAGHQHDRKVNAKSIAARLEVEPADARQADVEDDTSRRVTFTGIEKFL